MLQPRTVKMGAKATGENERDNWQTPQYILDLVDRFFFNKWFDPCPANPQFDLFRDEVNICTNTGIYINPPFSRYLDFVNQILPFPGEQIWMMHHDHSVKRQKLLMEKASAMCMIQHRVRFINPATGEASKQTAFGKSQTLIYIGPRPKAFMREFGALGQCVEL